MSRRHAISRALSLTAAVLSFGALPAASWSKPAVFAMPDGRQEVRDEADVAPYLAAWKASALARQRAMAQPMTANQNQYDARYYDLALTYNGTTNITGVARMKATVTSGPISTVDLDFYANMIVDAATSAGFASTFSRAGDVLTVNLDRAYATGELVDVTVTYHGNPTAAGYFGIETVNARTLVWSLSEPYGARSWWPCKDASQDKADSVDVHFTAPVAMITASNGKQVSRIVNGANATTNWHERHPIATYLVSVASYPYTVTDDWYKYTPTDSMLIRFHNYPESVAAYSPSQAKVKNMLAVYAGLFGQYPFVDEKYGHAQFQFGGGMEHQTCTSLGTSSESVVAHELGHQWWGDLVTSRGFHHIWLNEGFATYCEALWAEANGGLAAYQADIQLNRFLGPGTVYVDDTTDTNRIFDSNLTYNKGSWVLHMLRHVLGDATFFQSLRNYYTTWGYQTATTEDFRDVCEATSGRDLDAYFQQWVYGEYYPIYRTSWSSAPAGGGFDVTVTLQQVQSWQLFTMPVDVTIATTGGDQTFVVPDSLASQTVVLHVTNAPTGVAIDKDNWILKGTDPVVANPSFEKSVLLVNGVDWATYGTEITTAYTDQAFSSTYPIDFWDTFATPAGGYPAPLPAPLGHGAVPGSVLGHYRNVIWVGNNFNGDLAPWQDSPMLGYLRVGGNLLLMTRMGEQFLGDSLLDYLGVVWTNTGATLSDCIATRPGLTNIAPLGSNTLNAAFDTVRTTPESQLLFRAASGFSPTRGIGAIRIPPNGAGLRPRGGRFAFLSGRPYRWNHTQLKSNVATLLSSWFLEPLSGVPVDGAPVAHLSLAASPNPSGDRTNLRYALPRGTRVNLVLLDVAGRRVRSLVHGRVEAGAHEIGWDGRADDGTRVAAGIYWARLETSEESTTRRIVRIR